MEAEAEHDFTATADDELSFHRKDVLKILNKDEDPHWFRAELNGQEGYVPSNYIRMKPHKWYMGRIVRRDAESVLSEQTTDGAFLVRESESCPGDFSLSVKFKDNVQHFKVLRDSNGKYFLWSVKFNSLNELIEHHKTASVSRTSTLVLKEMCESSGEQPILVQAMFDFAPQGADELAFNRNDIITVTSKEDSNWWEGVLNNNRGMFPATYVCPYNAST